MTMRRQLGAEECTRIRVLCVCIVYMLGHVHVAVRLSVLDIQSVAKTASGEQYVAYLLQHPIHYAHTHSLTPHATRRHARFMVDDDVFFILVSPPKSKPSNDDDDDMTPPRGIVLLLQAFVRHGVASRYRLPSEIRQEVVIIINIVALLLLPHASCTRQRSCAYNITYYRLCIDSRAN